jgi:hypothetical protein
MILSWESVVPFPQSVQLHSSLLAGVPYELPIYPVPYRTRLPGTCQYIPMRLAWRVPKTTSYLLVRAREDGFSLEEEDIRNKITKSSLEQF